MIITISNVITDAGALTVTADDDTNQDIDDIITGDFSTKYTSLGSAATFVIDKVFTVGIPLTYVALAGHNFGVNGAVVEVKVNTVSKGSVTFGSNGRNNVAVWHFTEVASVTALEITVTKGSSTDQSTLTYLSCGEHMAVPQDGENTGYARPWLTDNREQKVSVNDQGAPVAILVRGISRKQTLSLANINRSFVESADWLSFLDRVYQQGDFFVKERDGSVIADDETSSYLCFNGEVMPPKAHGQTRELNNLQIRFNAYTGIS